MKLETFFESFAPLADAPNGVQKLRELILQLAVQGKLVPQDAHDEPASVLLAKIKAEKERLIQQKKIKKSETLPPIDLDQAPFDLPQGWEWARFPELGEFGRGKSKHRPRNDPKLYKDGHYKLVQTGDVARANGVIQTHTGLYNDVGLSQSRMWPKGTMCITIAANIADSGILGFDACFPDSVVGLIPSAEIGDAKYFEYFMRTAQDSLLDYAPSTAQKNINLGILETVLIPLPPLSEQRRIVAKVDQLMTLCDELEARQQRQQTARVKLNNAALEGLLTARARAEFAEHWQRICDNFDLLYDAPATVAALRQAILQLAVQGKLVPQDANDESFQNQQELISLQPIVEEEKFHELPQGWKWRRLGDISTVVRGGSPRPAGDKRFYDGEIPFLKVADLTATDDIYLHSHSYTIKQAGLTKTRYVEADTLMLTNSGATLGVPKICTFPTTFNDGIAAFLELPSSIDKVFLYYFLKSRTGWYRTDASRGQGQPNLNTDIIKATVLGIPPLAEQRRIVAKVDQLMALCDELEAKLRQAQTASAKLMTATVQHLAAESV